MQTSRRIPKNPQVGRNVRRLRVAQGISIRAFCALLDPPITPVQLLANEKGRQEPTLEMTRRYATALGVSVDELLADDEQDGKKRTAGRGRR